MGLITKRIFEDGENYDEFCRDTYFACCQVQMFR